MEPPRRRRNIRDNYSAAQADEAARAQEAQIEFAVRDRGSEEVRASVRQVPHPRGCWPRGGAKARFVKRTLRNSRESDEQHLMAKIGNCV
jgi:hypothetical protein